MMIDVGFFIDASKIVKQLLYYVQRYKEKDRKSQQSKINFEKNQIEILN